MPLFTRELNDLADRIGRAALTIWLHTAQPTDASPQNGRTTVGGGGYEAGIVVAPGSISNAANGDIQVTEDVDFGTADEDVGEVGWWSAYRGSDAVGYGTVPTTQIDIGDSFKINADELVIAGATT